MKRFTLAIVPLLAALASGCASPKVRAAANPRADLSALRTYAWAPADPDEQAHPQKPLDREIQSAAERELAKKGLVQAPDPAQADILVSYYAVTEDGVAFGRSPGPWRYGSQEEAVSVKEGSLTLEFIDPRTSQELWQGTAAGALASDEASPELVERAVKDLLSRYPSA